MTLINRILALALVCPFLTSCNIYKSLASPSNTEEYIEEAQRCLEDGDFACALSNYNKLPAGNLRNQKLCIVNIAQAGLGISPLIDLIANSSTGFGILGGLAEKLLPYSAAKESAAAAAVTVCLLLGTDDTSTLLKTLGYLVDCSIRIAKTDTLVSVVDDASTTCNSTTAGNASGTITAQDITKDGTGTVSNSEPGMCKIDIQACVADVISASALNSNLTSAGFGGIASNLNALSALTGGLADIAARHQISIYMP